jgi:hypothetical protein
MRVCGLVIPAMAGDMCCSTLACFEPHVGQDFLHVVIHIDYVYMGSMDVQVRFAVMRNPGSSVELGPKIGAVAMLGTSVLWLSKLL